MADDSGSRIQKKSYRPASRKKIIALVATSFLIIVGAAFWQVHNARVKSRLRHIAEGYRQKAQLGDASAQYRFGVCYYRGLGIERNYAEAVRWYRAAAEQRFAKAEYALGYLYHHGQGVKEDSAEAARWYREAAEQGDADAEYALGSLYENGDGVPRDAALAARWYREAAEQGSAMAQYELGFMYYKCDGVKRDYAEAVALYRKAAEQNDSSAQYSLGYMYYNGYGVPVDHKRAALLIQEAAAQGNIDARRSLGVGLSRFRELVLSFQLVGGAILIFAALLPWKHRGDKRRTISFTAGTLCLLAVGFSWYGYRHYMIWCFIWGMDAFSLFKWSLDGIVIALLVFLLLLQGGTSNRFRSPA